MSVANEKPKPYLIQGLWPHEIAFLGLFCAAMYAGQNHIDQWPKYVYGAAFLAAFPVLWFRCRAEWGQMPNRGLFAILTAVWAALFFCLGLSTFRVSHSANLFFWMFNVWSSPMVDEGHGMLIPFVVLILIWWKRRDLAAESLKLWWPGMLLVAAGLLSHLAGYVVEQPRLSVIGLFVGFYGIMGLAWGPRWLKTIFFPYFLLAFCVPVGELGIPLTLRLRILVAEIVATIAQFGLAPDVVRQGTQLLDSQHTFGYDVAPACSGIRSLVAMLALTIIYGFLSFKPAWKRLVMVAAALPLAVLGNVARLSFTLVVAETFGQAAGKSVETYAGYITFGVAIGSVLLLGRWLEKSEVKPPGQSVTA